MILTLEISFDIEKASYCAFILSPTTSGYNVNSEARKRKIILLGMADKQHKENASNMYMNTFFKGVEEIEKQVCKWGMGLFTL